MKIMLASVFPILAAALLTAAVEQPAKPGEDDSFPIRISSPEAAD